MARPAGDGPRLLAVFAHPDDESLASGGLLALCSRRGARVALLCLTRGEHGADADAARALARTRTRELQEAARELGVDDVYVGELPDGMLPWLDEGVLDSEIHDVLTRTRPEVVVTFDEDGLYWHPDHVAVHHAVTRVVRQSGSDGPALYYVTMPPGQMRAIAEAAASRRPGKQAPLLFGIESADAFGACAPPPTLVVDVREHAALKLAALRCHRSQVVDGWIDVLTDDDARALLGVEHYRRAAVGSPGPAFIERLTAAPARDP